MNDISPEIRRRVEHDLAILEPGTVEIYSRDELAGRLAAAYTAGRPLRVKLGMDPTAPDIHLGHVVQLQKMRQFQNLGHKAVLIIGDYTARVGDPSGQNKMRPVLTEEEIESNAATYLQQAGKVLDLDPEKIEIRRNSQWLSQLSFADVIKLTSKMTVARMLERDTFDIRYKAGDAIGIHEFLYPLMQGYDSLMIDADVELGGTDQTFNNLVGRDLQRDAGKLPQIVMIMPLLVGLDGTQKMSKSKGNYVGVTDEPADMFGKLMSIPDNLMSNYFELLTEVSAEERRRLTGGEVHPRQAKEQLALTIVERFHGSAAARGAAEEFARIFSRRQMPTEIAEAAIPAAELDGEGRIWIARLITLAGFAGSSSEAARLVKQGAVSLDEQPVKDTKANVEVTDGAVLKVGKRRFARLVRR